MDIKTLSGTLYAGKGWMKLVGVMMIIYGALAVLTIVGILFAWLPIWMGVLLFQSAGAIERAYLAEDEVALQLSLAKLKTYFTITGVLTLIGLVGFLFMFLLGGAAMHAGLQ